MHRIGVTGGIGSGKTTVCKIFAALGVPVYIADDRAKELMRTDPAIRGGIIATFGPEAYAGDTLNTQYIASRAFTDKSVLSRLNAIVHPGVMADFDRWADGWERKGAPYVIQENAVLFEGGFDAGVDIVVTISAPLEQRIQRASGRDNADPERIRQRAANQMGDQERETRADYVLSNEEQDMLLPEILSLHEKFSGAIKHDNVI